MVPRDGLPVVSRESMHGPDQPSGAAQHAAPRPIQRSHWWREVLLIAAFYGLYTLVRDLRGDRPVSHFQALTNAHRIVSLEQHLGVFFEAHIQHWFLDD